MPERLVALTAPARAAESAVWSLPRAAWAAAVFAFALRAALVLMPGAPPPQVFEHEGLVTSLLEGRGFVLEFHGVPYHTFQSYLPYLALNLLVCGLTNHNHVVLLLTQAVVTAGLVLVIHRIAAMLFGPAAALAAALLTATHPGLLLYDTRKLHTLGLDTLLLCGCVLAMMTLRADASVTRRGLVGMLLGLTLLGRGTIVLFAVAAPIAVAWAHRRSVVGAARFLVPLVLGGSLVVMPWLARSFVLYHAFVVQTPSGEHFWRGNHHGATGTGYTVDGRLALDGDPQMRAAIAGLDELGQMRAFTAAGVAFWQESPGEAVGLFFRKLLAFFTWTPTTGKLYPHWQLRVYFAYYAASVALALAGASTLLRRTARGTAGLVRALPFLAVGSVAIVQSVFYVETRHRWGVEPLILVMTAGGIVQMWSLVMDRRRGPAR